eukprot:CAMPEP_0198317844 /NCGR_PEP_ID=MMETSP1450-20131203/7257_1 /TAXON_ID=753684 ORGANISM="Madagascaria erythrocladiodes, Strain CCMP3234" /NCGR_SAMPLE_ID=MMETSP1450 /ASSEMBLY_ACC=CAM_ASM_001115 /LENGTH=393 /DNA_ID=CAMNT_0044021091 /DNA_START=143 /DNA_END=1324 /DNA_ORIENTATION=-
MQLSFLFLPAFLLLTHPVTNAMPVPPRDFCNFVVLVDLSNVPRLIEWQLRDANTAEIVKQRFAGQNPSGVTEIDPDRKYTLRIRDLAGAKSFESATEAGPMTDSGGTYAVQVAGQVVGDGVLQAEEYVAFEVEPDCSVLTPQPLPNFGVMFVPDETVPAELVEAMESAALRWEIVINAGLTPKSYLLRGERVWTNNLRIDVAVRETAAAGKLVGFSKVLGIRGPSDKYQPYYVQIIFDKETLAGRSNPFRTGFYEGHTKHMLGHALGMNRLVWESNKFWENGSYVGPNALREYEKLVAASGGSSPCKGCIPLDGENWKESVFENELMTPRFNTNWNRLSRMTVGALADVGFTVRYGKADPYELPASFAGASARMVATEVGDLDFEGGDASFVV